MSTNTSASTKDEILATALHLFKTQGYDATSLRQIAERLGFTKAALYYHFPAKDHLVIELSRPWLDALSNLVTLYQQDAEEPPGPRTTRRDALLLDYVDMCIAHHAMLRFLSQDAAALKHPDVGKRARTLVAALQDALAGPEASDSDRIRSTCAVVVVHAITMLDESMLPAARPIVASAALRTLHGPATDEAAG